MSNFNFKLPSEYESLNFKRAKRGKTFRIKYSPKTLREIVTPFVNSLSKPIPLTWNNEDVLQWLLESNLNNCVEIFRQNMITGRKLLNLSPNPLCQMNIRDFKNQNRILTLVRKLFHTELYKHSRSVSVPKRHPTTQFTIHNTITGPGETDPIRR